MKNAYYRHGPEASTATQDICQLERRPHRLEESHVVTDAGAPGAVRGRAGLHTLPSVTARLTALPKRAPTRQSWLLQKFPPLPLSLC